MAIESAVLLRRVARNACLVLIVGLLMCSAASAQLPIKAPVPVTVGSIIPFGHGSTGQWSQIYAVKVAHNGSVLFLDTPLSNLYQWTPGAAAPTLVVGPAATGQASNGSTLEAASSYWNSGMALDANDTLYITDRYGSAVNFLRVPYDKASGTWLFSSSSNWTQSPTTSETVDGETVNTKIRPQDIAIGDDGTFYTTWSNLGEIDKFTVDANGNSSPAVKVATGLKASGNIISVDHAGNIYILENPYSMPSTRANGVLVIPANASLPLIGDSSGSLEASLTRIDPASAGFNFKGMSFDAAGNLYLSSLNDGGNYGGYVNMLLMVPNEGTPQAPNLVWNDTVQVAPVVAGFAAAVDPRGYIWIPNGSTGNNWAPQGTLSTACSSLNVAGCTTSGVILWAPGSLGLGSSPVGTPGTTQTILYGFSQATTIGTVSLTQPGSKNISFTPATKHDGIPNPTPNPNPDPSYTTQVEPCTPGTVYPTFSSNQNSVAQFSWCAVYLQLNAQAAGSVSGELQLLDSSKNIIPGSNAYLNGIGEGAAISVLSPPAIQAVALGLQAPQQVAADSLGNSYVADSTLGTIEQYPLSQGSTVVGTAYGTNLTKPTGVAVDGAGDLYIGDTGKVIEIPFINGALATKQQTTLLTGLGDHLNLAADGLGNVYVADQDNKQVVKISNPELQLVLQNQPLNKVGSGVSFTGPSAIATDSSNNIWVADGSNLWEISPTGNATEITSSLAEPVTGLAIDPSGSIFVAQSGGLFWIPFEASSGGLNVNGAIQLVSTLGSSANPFSVALDGFQNALVTYGSGTTAGLSQVGTGGSIDWGQIVPNQGNDQEAQIYNIGNSSLMLSDFSGDLFTGANASDYLVGTPYDTPACSASSAILPGTGCYYDITLTPSNPSGASSASLAILSNAANAPSVNVALAANIVPDLRSPTTTSIAVTPSSGIVYPGSVSIAVTVSAVTASNGTPSGTVTLYLTGEKVQTAQLVSGVATFTFSNLIGGPKTVRAEYGGAGVAGTAPDFAGSASKSSFTVAVATPVIAVGAPVGDTKSLTVWNGNTYLGETATNTITASVTSAVGTPTGTVSFLQNGKPVDSTQAAISLDANGNATFTTVNLPVGVYNLTAVYSGDVNFGSVSFALPTFQVIVASVQITANPSTLTLTPGVPNQTTLTLKPLVGFNEVVGIQCVTKTLPEYSECTFAFPPASNGLVTVGGTSDAAPTTIAVTISTNVPVNGVTSSYRARPLPWSLAGFFGLGVAGLYAGRKRCNRYMAMLCLAVMLSGAFMSIAACTNAGYSTPLPAPKVTTASGTYQVQIVAVDPSTGQQESLSTPLFTLPTTVN